jgi:large subunit ribosomal protein L9
MDVVLIENVPSLGRKGEVKKVADGYARNFIIPRGLGAMATKKNIAKFAQIVKQEKKKQDKKSAGGTQLAGKLRSVTLTITEKADESGTFFAGVTKDKLAKALLEKGLDVKAKQIELPEAIKTAGSHKITVKLDKKLTSEFRVVTQAG